MLGVGEQIFVLASHKWDPSLTPIVGWRPEHNVMLTESTLDVIKQGEEKRLNPLRGESRCKPFMPIIVTVPSSCRPAIERHCLCLLQWVKCRG